MASKKTEKVQKTRIEDADVTEISLVPAGAVEDADYVVLHKESPEEEPSEELAKAVEAIITSRELLSDEQIASILTAIVPAELEKEDSVEEEETVDQMEDSDSDEDETAEKECDSEMQKSVDERVAALELRIEELLAKLAPATDEVAVETEEIAKEQTEQEELNPVEVAARILQERALAKEQQKKSASEARLLASMESLLGKLDSVDTGLSEAKRQLARACGQDA